MGVMVVERSVSVQRQEALRFFNDAEIPHDIDAQAGRPERPDGAIVLGDVFDNARFIAEQRRPDGSLDQAVLWHMNWQRATQMSESMGSFDHQSVIGVDANGCLESFGEQESRTRLRAVLAAFAMEKADAGFGFYVWRTLFENHHKQREQTMIDAEPVGSALMLISPPEQSHYGRRLGMFPERDMAVMQISWKHASDAMTLRTVSLDKASLRIVRELLAEQRIEVAGDAKPEDFIAYVKRLHFESQAELDSFVDKIVTRFDELVARDNPKLVQLSGKPKRGIFGHDARNAHSSASVIMEAPHGQLALRQEHKLDFLLADHVHEACPLAKPARMLAQQCLMGRRSDGSSLLPPDDQAAIRQLLAADGVSLDNPDHAKALKLVMYVHNSAIEESLRDFLAGDLQAMDWMKGDDISLAAIKNIVATGAWAIENGRGSEGCGSGGIESGGLPDPRLYPNEYLIALYGRHNLHHGSCDGCGRMRLVGNCRPALCGTCDAGRRRRH